MWPLHPQLETDHQQMLQHWETLLGRAEEGMAAANAAHAVDREEAHAAAAAAARDAEGARPRRGRRYACAPPARQLKWQLYLPVSCSMQGRCSSRSRCSACGCMHAAAAARAAELEAELAERRREAADMEECIGALHTAAEAREGALAAQAQRADAAVAAGRQLDARLADREATIAAQAAAQAEQVCAGLSAPSVHSQ